MGCTSETGGLLAFQRAQRAIAADNTLAGLTAMEKALREVDNPAWYSYLGYCIARERGQVAKGLEMCQVSLAQEPDNPDHYLNMGKVLLLAGDTRGAIGLFRRGEQRWGGAVFGLQLKSLGVRAAPVIPFLGRGNPVNKFLGLLLRRNR